MFNRSLERHWAPTQLAEIFGYTAPCCAAKRLRPDNRTTLERYPVDPYLTIITMPPTLPQIDSCTDCGACCERTPIPPFLPGEAELLNVPFAWLVAIRDRIAADLQFDLLPCVWYDIATRRCLHYAHRPAACRDFERNSQPCRSVRQLQAEQTQTPE